MALPREVWAHGYVQWEGTKMSKTAGTAVSLDEAIERHGPDALRYFLLREVGFEADGNFTWERFDERYTADLADGLGNLASRSLAMLAKYRDGVVPAPPSRHTARRGRRGRRSPRTPRRWMRSTCAAARRRRGSWWPTANLYIQQVAPWAWPRRAGRRSWTSRSRRSAARSIGWRCWPSPFIPGKAQVLWQSLGLAREDLTRRRGARLEAPAGGGASYQQARGAVPQAAELSRS